MDRLPILLAVLLSTTALVGCIGDEGAPETQSTPDVPQPDEGAGAPAVAYRPGVGPGSSGALEDVGESLPGGLPLPTGTGRLVDAPLFEPTIGVTSDGTLFVSNLDGSRATDWSSILRSTDQGATWEDVTGSIGPLSSPPQSNDPYVYVDPRTDRVYNLDMQGLQCNWIRWSDDAGDSWTTNPLGCGQPPVLDHPTIFAGPPQATSTTGYENVVYLCVNRVGDSACATSLDGGLTWTPFKTVFPGGEAPTDDPTAAEEGFCGGLHAHGTTGPDGTAYLPKGQCGVPMVAISEDDGLTWELVTISEDIPADGHEVAFAVDDAGNAFAFWISTDLQPYLAISTDAGRTWNDPMNVAPPGVHVTDKPTIAAGQDGGVAMAYVGTEANVEAYGDVDEDATWNAYMTLITDATREDPLAVTTTAHDRADPIARGECGGTRCFGESRGALGDFIDVVIDEDGRPWVAFVDVCTQACAQPDGEHNDEGLGLVGTLAEGPSLRQPGQALPALAPSTT